MTIVFAFGVCLAVIAAVVVGALIMVTISPRSRPEEKDIFGFAALKATPEAILPPLHRYTARDGEQLAYRFYDSTVDQVLIFVHGSSYHGSSYHDLASSVSSSGAAKVVLPNLRGHFQSGRHRGDVQYIGQLEDDIADLIAELRSQDITGPIVLGGHSSGGGFVMRFAGGRNASLVSQFLMLSPVIPTSSTLRAGSAGGWAQVSMLRLSGLLVMNAFGIRGFNALPVIEFNKPAQFLDGTETLSYSYRLNASYHPRNNYSADMRHLANKATILIGENDEAVGAHRLQTLISRKSPTTRCEILPDVNHFAIFTSGAVHKILIEWLAQCGETRLTKDSTVANKA